VASESVARDSATRALSVALVVAFVCGSLVSAVSVGLRPYQQANIEAERRAQLELVLSALADTGHALSIDVLEARVVELASGRYDDTLDAATFDAEAALAKPERSVAVPADFSFAGIKRRARHARVYLVRDASEVIELIILPVWGRGYQSALRAWLVLDGDTRTVRALKFYEHGETPGVGARIEEPEWESRWRDVRAFDDNWTLRIGVNYLGAGGGADSAGHRVDGITGATRTSQGIDGLLRFWLGDFGFGPYLRRIREEQG
jgi:Na+-transporting NADH:ubiquinone oxidoreductase subunit C